MLYWKPFRHSLLLVGVSFLVACGGGSDNQKPSHTVNNNPSQSNPAAASSVHQELSSSSSAPVYTAGDRVTIVGQITYDRIPFASRSYYGLDYDNIRSQPTRGVIVQAVNKQLAVVATGITDSDGRYSLRVPENTDIQIRVPAELLSSSPSQWSVQVRDNTNGNAQYRLEGSFANSGSDDSQERNLHAASGWDGESYSQPRSAGPFAILDSIYDALILLDQAQPGQVLPTLSVYWSPRNIAISGNRSSGHIGTSFYSGSGPSIYILGAENNDSDEYDRAVIQHEFGHYIEHQLARTESLGGSHTQHSRLDIRVAFGEAWGNAFAGMASNDPVYRDSYGASQALAFSFDVERRGIGNKGWYSESTIQNILYDLYDSHDDGGDPLALGFKPILDTLTSSEYLNFNGFASIYPFIDTLKSLQGEHAQAIDTFVKSFNIQGEGGYAEGETNDGGSDVVLPLYHSIEPNQTAHVCSDADFQDYNGVDVRRFVRASIPVDGTYTISAIKTDGGLSSANPQIRVFQRGSQITSLTSGSTNREVGDRRLSAGEYIFEIYEEANVDQRSDNSGLVCFNFTIR